MQVCGLDVKRFQRVCELVRWSEVSILVVVLFQMKFKDTVFNQWDLHLN